MNHVIDETLAALRGVIRPKGFTPLHEPCFEGNEWTYVKECLDTGWVSSVGKFVDRLEQDMAAYTGARRAVAVVNGTCALQVALQLAGVSRDDEVIIPALTFVATANAVAHLGAVPHLADSSAHTLGMDPDALEAHLSGTTRRTAAGTFNSATGRRIAAVVPMHTFGHPVDMDRLLEVCARYELPVVEDAAESLGSFYKGTHTGNHGLISALSFNGNKTITTGGGGMIITNDEALADRAKHLTTTAKTPHRWEFNHDEIAYNYRMPNLNAALGCAQLEKLPEFIRRKRALAADYAAAFKEIEGVRFFVEPDFAQSNYWLNSLLLDDPAMRDGLLAAANDAGIMTRPAWTLMHRLPMYADAPRMELPVAEGLAARLVNIPSGPALGRDL